MTDTDEALAYLASVKVRADAASPELPWKVLHNNSWAGDLGFTDAWYSYRDEWIRDARATLAVLATAVSAAVTGEQP